MTSDAVGVFVGLDHHCRGVPPDVGADAPLDVFVAGEPRLLLARNGVDVWRRHHGWETDLEFAAALEQLRDQVAGAGLSFDFDDGFEAVEPLLGLARIDVGQLVDEAIEDHGFILSYARLLLVRGEWAGGVGWR